MSKFKVGDKVKVLDVSKIALGKEHYFTGMKTEVVKISGDWIHLKNIYGEQGVSIRPDEIDAIKLIESKLTKNQRITDLEITVKSLENDIVELKLIVHQLRQPSTDVQEALDKADWERGEVEGVIRFEGKPYRKVGREAREGDVVIFTGNGADERYVTKGKPYKVYMHPNNDVYFKDNDNDAIKVYDGGIANGTPETVDVYELIVEDKPKTTNQLRAEIIEKAKAFVDENGGDDYHFDIDEKKGTVFAYKVITSSVGRYGVKYGFSECHPNDVFNADIGKAISFGRAEKKDVSEFEQAVQPDEVVVGMLVKNAIGNVTTVTEKYEDFTTNSIDWLNENEGYATIINDTNAQYGGAN